MKIRTFIFSLIAILLASCDQNGSPKTQEEIVKNAIDCVDNFLTLMEKGDYNEAENYCFPYTIGGESFSLRQVIMRTNSINRNGVLIPSDNPIKKDDFVISPDVEIETMENTYGSPKFKYAVVNAKRGSEDAKFYVIFDRGNGENSQGEQYKNGQPTYGNTIGRAVIVDSDGLFPEVSGDNETFPNVKLDDAKDVLSLAIMDLRDIYRNQTYSKVIDLRNRSINSSQLPFINAFDNCINYTICNDAKPYGLEVKTKWDDLIINGFSPERGIGLDNMEVLAVFSTGLGFKLNGKKIVDSYNLLDLKRYYAKYYSDINPVYIMPSSHYFTYGIGDAALIEEMAKKENTARQQTRLYH